MTAVATDDVRAAAKYLVAQEEYRRGSRMLAYRAVGAKVGTSDMWVRRFVKGYGGSGLNWVVGRKIMDAYETLCTRVENNNDQIRRDIANAAAEGTNPERVVESEASYRTHTLLPPNEL